jgi:acetyl esterase/lipase
MRTLLPLTLLVFVFSCQKNPDPGTTSLAAQTYTNISYGSNAKQVMDIYLPAGRTVATTKVIILIHGGAWSTGDKSEFAAYVDTLKKRLPDYAIFNINYRLASLVGDYFPAQENDVKSAYEFILNKASEYKISQKVALLGASAGAHLALLQGYKYSSPVKPKAIIDFFGPTELVALYNGAPDPSIIPLLEILIGGSPTSNPTMYQQSSPINFVNAQSPPTLILHGGLDMVVPVSQSTSLKTKLETMGVTNQYLFYPTEGHDVWTAPNLNHAFNAIQAFITANVN